MHYAVKRMLVHTGVFRLLMTLDWALDDVNNCLTLLSNPCMTLCVLACQSNRGNSMRRNDEKEDNCTPSAKK